MSLEPCRTCGQRIASTAPTCPHCGEKHPAFETYLAAEVRQQRWQNFKRRLWPTFAGTLAGYAGCAATLSALRSSLSPSLMVLGNIGGLFLVPSVVWLVLLFFDERALQNWLESQRALFKWQESERAYGRSRPVGDQQSSSDP